MLNAPHMSALERDLYEAGHSEEYRGFTIEPKRDFGRCGFWSSEHRSSLNAGWVICYGSGTYRGCNAMPAATFAWTLKSAREMIDDLIAAGGNGRLDNVNEDADAQLFWKLHYERNGIEYAAR